MSKIALTPNSLGSGTFTIASPNSDTDRVLTLPDEAGTVLTSASVNTTSVPAFDANLASNTSLGSGTTHISSNAFTENFDYGSNFNVSTGIFTAPVSGVYMFNMRVWTSSNDASTDFNIALTSSGSTKTLTAQITSPVDVGVVYGTTESAVVYMDAGDTAYMTFYSNDSSWTLLTSTRFSGFLVRAS